MLLVEHHSHLAAQRGFVEAEGDDGLLLLKSHIELARHPARTGSGVGKEHHHCTAVLDGVFDDVAILSATGEIAGRHPALDVMLFEQMADGLGSVRLS